MLARLLRCPHAHTPHSSTHTDSDTRQTARSYQNTRDNHEPATIDSWRGGSATASESTRPIHAVHSHAVPLDRYPPRRTRATLSSVLSPPTPASVSLLHAPTELAASLPARHATAPCRCPPPLAHRLPHLSLAVGMRARPSPPSPRRLSPSSHARSLSLALSLSLRPAHLRAQLTPPPPAPAASRSHPPPSRPA